MKPAKEEIKIIKVDVSIALLMGIKNRRVIIETKKMPPPTPEITEIVPAKKPRNINKTIIPSDSSINTQISFISKSFLKCCY